MPTFVHFADLHLDTAFRRAGADAARRRRQSLRDVLDDIVALALEVGADALCCGGDLYEHELTAPDTGEVLRAAFSRLGDVPVLVAPGNHDWLGPRSLYARTAWSPNVHLFSSASLQPFELLDGLTVWGAAHLVPAGTPGFLDGFHVDRGGVHVGLFHGSLRSGLAFQEDGKAPHAPFDAEQVTDAGLHHALVGHYHKPLGDSRFTYPGNPEPLGFGESGEGGAVVATVADDGTVTVQRRSVARTRAHEVSVDLTGAGSGQEVRSRVAEALGGLDGIARVHLVGEVGAEIVVEQLDLATFAAGLLQVEWRFEQLTAAYDLDAIAAQTGTVRGRFVADVLADAALDDDTRRRVLHTGLRALDGRDDLEVL